MKKMILSILVLASITAAKAQSATRDSSMMNGNDYKTDSVKRGNNVYIDGNHSAKTDTTTKHKTQPNKKTAGTKPKRTTTGNVE